MSDSESSFAASPTSPASADQGLSANTTCPSRETLIDFLSDRLAETDVDAVVLHVETCSKCQHQLDVLADKSGVTRRLPSIPGFRVEAELGRGGMGSVYLAQSSVEDLVVAIKLLPEEYLSDPERRQRFLREIETLSRLSHPNIVRIFQSGFSERQPYFVMEYVSGLTLGQFTRSIPLAPQTASEIIRLVAEAVEFAHANQVIHRDLKPSNIILTPSAEGTIRVGGGDIAERRYDVKLLDFGLAKHVDQTSMLTRSGELLGTLGYMAPEQVLGGKVGPAADVYACGVLLYELLSGRTPHQASTLPDLINQIHTVEPISLRALVPTIPKDLETICHKCLEKAPEKRYASAAELAADLEAFGRSGKITARPVSVMRKFFRWTHRHPVASTLIGSATILLLFGLATVSWMLRQSQLSNEALTKEQNRTLVQSAKVQELNSTLKEESRRRQNLNAALLDELYYPHAPEARIKLLKENLSEVDQDAQMDPKLATLWNAVRLRVNIIQESTDLGPLSDDQLKEVLTHYQQALNNLKLLDDQKQTNGTNWDYEFTRMELHAQLGNIYKFRDEQDKALELFTEAIQILDSLEKSEPEPNIQNRLKIARVNFENGRLRSQMRKIQKGDTKFNLAETNESFKENVKEIGFLVRPETLDPRDKNLCRSYCEGLKFMTDYMLAANSPEYRGYARAIIRVWLDAQGCWEYSPAPLLKYLGELCEQSGDVSDRKLLADCLRRNLQAHHRSNPDIQAVLKSEVFERLMSYPELESPIREARRTNPKELPGYL